MATKAMMATTKTATKATSSSTTSHTAMPAHVTSSLLPSSTSSPATLSKRGHIRSASLENANSFISKNTLGLPVVQPGHTGTLKSRNEQKRMRNKFGSHSNLEDYVQQGRTKFQNIRQMFEISRKASKESHTSSDKEGQMMQSLPTIMTTSTPAIIPTTTSANVATYQQQTPTMHAQPQTRTQAYTPQQQQLHAAYQQHYAAQQQAHQLPRKPTPTTPVTGCGNRNSISELNERLNIVEGLDANGKVRLQQQQQPAQQQYQQQAQQQHAQPQQRQHSSQQQQQQQQAQQQRSASGLAHLQPDSRSESADQATNLLRPIAFKPIPFEPDYSIPHRYCDVAGDRYGSTPSLAPVQGSNLRFGSTTDLRHGSSGGVVGVGGGSGSGGGGGGFVGGYSSNNYCNSLMARRRGSRSLKINDSLESIRHTPDSDANSQSSTIKSNCSNSNANGSNSSSGNNKYVLSEQCDMTPSPSDSGISELEAALKDRDSELSYLRQTMEHNEKDKEAFWENETKRLKTFYEGQQREYFLKIKKMEQMLAMQQFQFKQHKLRHTEQANKLREQMSDMKNENEILRTNNSVLKNSERNLSDRVAYIEEQLRETLNTIGIVKAQLEESEWKVCERNGEIALLKTQLKVEITMKEHAIVHLKHENTNAETQIYQSLQENHKIAQLQRQEEEHKAQSQKETETELKQLNKIVILKDQVILALTNELAKLRKELSDLAILHEYGEEPSGKYTRLKQQLDNLTDICNRTRKHTQKLAENDPNPKEKVIDDTNLEVIMNCLKIAPPLDDEQQHDNEENVDMNNKLSAEKRLAKMSADIQKFVYGAQNLPDVAVNLKAVNLKFAANNNKLEESTLDTLIEESANYAEEISKLRQQLDDVRVNFELEKRQWGDEKEKVLCYQKQLQTHYINMYQKLRNLESSNDVV